MKPLLQLLTFFQVAIDPLLTGPSGPMLGQTSDDCGPYELRSHRESALS